MSNPSFSRSKCSTLRKPNVLEKNVVRHIEKISIYGRPNRPNRLHQNVSVSLDRFNCLQNVEIVNFFSAIKNLEEVLDQPKFRKTDAFRMLCIVKDRMTDLIKKEERPGRYSECQKFFKHQALIDCTEVLQRFVMSYTICPTRMETYSEMGDILKFRGIAFEVFHYVFVMFENSAERYCEDHDFIVCLFTHLQFIETCFPACKLLESLLISRTKILDLSTIDNLKDMVVCFGDVALGNFCKILAITLSELDMYEHKTSLYAQTKQKRSENFYIRDINQDTILKIPKILPRLVNLACAKPYVPWFPDVHVESKQWLKWIDNQCEEEINSGNVAQFIGGITEYNKYGVFGPNSSAGIIAAELTFRADAVCVLGLLLVGRHRKEVQKELADLQLVPRLSDLFDHFIWKSHTRSDHTRLPGHNSACECSPEVALKIQVLRLIHSFCDHSDYKHVMLSWNEYSELKSLEETSSISSSLPCITKELMCVGIKGFLSKIVEVMKEESGASTFRFWLSRAIESYLRGSNSCIDQDFLIRRQLIQHVVGNLITSNIRHKEVLQSSFDLLGELIRFNITAFKQLNIHVFNQARQRKLLSLMNGSLVDSNMFIRSVILSYENFVSSTNSEIKDFAEKECFLLSYVSTLNIRVHYLQKLLSLINIYNLTQDVSPATWNDGIRYASDVGRRHPEDFTRFEGENVSCLNTALVILMFALRKGELPQYLNLLASNQEGCSVATDQSDLLHNLKDLLIFWQDHYLQKDKDCTILERGSRIPFQEWKDTIALLTSDNPENPNSIAFFTIPAVSSRAS